MFDDFGDVSLFNIYFMNKSPIILVDLFMVYLGFIRGLFGVCIFIRV